MIFCDISGEREEIVGLGNNLFKIATCLSLAKENNTKVFFSNWRYDLFDNIDFNKKREDLKIIHDYYEQTFHFSKIEYTKNTEIHGYFQSEKYFINNKNYILEKFTLNQKNINYINKKYKWIINSNTVSIHVRRGDYVTNDFDYVLKKEYFINAMQMMKLKMKVDKFIVFSDDIEWCENNFIGNEFYFVKGEKDYIDLFLMSMCSHNIISNSTFSWWAAWLNKNKNKQIIYPDQWFSKTSFKGNFNIEDLLPKDWIKNKKIEKNIKKTFNVLKQNKNRKKEYIIPTFLLSFPRSGNTWVRYCIEYITKRTTTSCPNSIYPDSWPISSIDNNSMNSFIKIKDVKEEEPHIFIKKHKIFSEEINNYPMIFLIRNYKECLIRQYGINKAREYIYGNIKDIFVNDYIEAIQYFDEWENNKILFYYEDIILNPKIFLLSLSSFFGISNKKLIEDFIENIDFHIKNGIKCYYNINEESITKGEKNKIIFHSNLLSIKEKIEWDNEIKKKNLYIFNKYLQRYI